MNDNRFHDQFTALTGYTPFPWQQALYNRLIGDPPDNIPVSCNLPTGLGKTSVIAVWLVALAHQMESRAVTLPRRLVYVVNRRTVVDQTTTEVERYRKAMDSLDGQHPLKQRIGTLAISTLRGQFADNREWSANPSRPAVICGTVDMIGSRLLFSGYGVGFRSKPLHAGFLGQDALLVHDEAHLEPAFQTLIERIKCEQEHCRDFTGFYVMALSATTRGSDGQADSTFTLTPADSEHRVVKQRIKAAKHLRLTPAEDDKQTAGKIAEIAAGYKDANAAVLVFARTLEAVSAIDKELAKTKRHIVLLTGTMRGKERDELVEKPEFKRFLKGAAPGETVYLVCTSAGEVGIDISADHMVCDLSTFDSMAQRFGRVNRYGDRTHSRIDVVHPTSFGKTDKTTGELKADEIDKRRQKTLGLLNTLPAIGDDQHDASPLALSNLDPDERLAAFAPEPTIPLATDILYDAWALTSIRQEMPGRPPVEPYLHGIAEWQPPETYVAWRREVQIITGDLLNYPPTDLLDAYPLLPHELLRDATDRKNTGALAQLRKMATRCPEAIIWIVDSLGGVKPEKLQEVADGDSRRLYGATIVLPPSVGGLTAAGTLDGDAPFVETLNYDVADCTHGPNQRIRIHPDDSDYETRMAKAAGMRRVRSIELADNDVDGEEPRRWEWFESFPSEGGRTASKPVTWKTHVGDVVERVKRIVAALSLPPEIAAAVILAAELHDHGKKRERFQITLGNRRYPGVLLAKAGRGGARLPEPFRHEFGSLLDARADERFNALSDEMKDLVLHLIAAHHGRARPHFAVEEAFDPEHPSTDAEAMAIETPRRFGRLQRRYGRWGLAYLESVLRAADWAASAAPSKVLDAHGNEVTP